MRPMKTTLSRPFKLLTPDESWIFKIVEPFREKFLSSASLWCPLQPQSGSVANLIAILKHPRSEEDEEKNTPQLPDVVKEIVVFRSPPTLHVYDVYEYVVVFERENIIHSLRYSLTHSSIPTLSQKRYTRTHTLEHTHSNTHSNTHTRTQIRKKILSNDLLHERYVSLSSRSRSSSQGRVESSRSVHTCGW